MTSIPVPPPPPSLLPFKDKVVADPLVSDDLCIKDLELFESKVITKIKPIIQSGPKCGIIALAMVASTTTSCKTVDDIYSRAKYLGFTNNGEMFSAYNMSVLANDVCGSWFCVELLSGSISSHSAHVVDSLSKGDLMLVPYDADKDHSPCCKDGHKAHWALVCGILTDSAQQIWVAARHGKSRYLAVWPLQDLTMSNDNLTELDPQRESDNNEYIVPAGGVRAGLCSQFILLHKKI